MSDYPVTYVYSPTTVCATVPALPGLYAVAPTYEEVRGLIQAQVARHMQADDDAPLPWLLDAGPCPHCATPLVWTQQPGLRIRTAWSLHWCPGSGGQPLCPSP